MPDPSTPRTWVIKPLQISQLTDGIEITAGGVTIGRSETNTLVIPEAGFPYVSSHHARLRLDNDVPTVEDLGSKNGTLVNGAAVERAELANGDILQLGNMGPRFAVVCADPSAQSLKTVVAPTLTGIEAQSEKGERELSQSSLFRIKKGLGIPANTNIEDLIRRRNRRIARRGGLAALLIVIGVGVVFWILSDQREVEAARLREINGQLTAQLSAERERQEQQKKDWRDEKTRLETESTTLAARLQRLELGAGSSASELGTLRDQLAETHKRLEAYNPLNTEADGLEQVRRATRAVVFIEAKLYFRHSSGKRLFAERTSSGRRRFNFDDVGEPVALESSGSGFVVTDQGWILTNAHVVEPDTKDSPFTDDKDSVIRPEVELGVVFSGTSVHHPARVVRSVLEDGIDIALLKIEPFEGMPHLAAIDVNRAVPEPMTEVYLSGFPLGLLAVQDGQVLIASTFKGILSRVVKDYFQIDAAVHPGNSGGPVMDTRGRILGIATRVQRTPGGDYTPTIGYITPIQVVGRIWPPPEATAGKTDK